MGDLTFGEPLHMLDNSTYDPWVSVIFASIKFASVFNLLADYPRDEYVLATKVYGSMTDWPNDTFLSARNIVRACEASLRRLQTDWIDLYQFHHVDLSTPWEEIW